MLAALVELIRAERGALVDELKLKPTKLRQADVCAFTVNEKLRRHATLTGKHAALKRALRLLTIINAELVDPRTHFAY